MQVDTEGEKSFLCVRFERRKSDVKNVKADEQVFRQGLTITGDWKKVSKFLFPKRDPQSVYMHWKRVMNKSRKIWTREEEEKLVELERSTPNRWGEISRRLGSNSESPKKGSFFNLC